MYYREASAAYESHTIGQWPYLPSWHKAFIIAITESKAELSTALYDN